MLYVNLVKDKLHGHPLAKNYWRQESALIYFDIQYIIYSISYNISYMNSKKPKMKNFKIVFFISSWKKLYEILIIISWKFHSILSYALLNIFRLGWLPWWAFSACWVMFSELVAVKLLKHLTLHIHFTLLRSPCRRIRRMQLVFTLNRCIQSLQPKGSSPVWIL